MRVVSPDGAAHTPRPVCLSHRATGAHLLLHVLPAGEPAREAAGMYQTDWRFLAAATPCLLVSSPTTSSHQHVLTLAPSGYALHSYLDGAQEADRRATQTQKEAAGMEEYSNVNRLYWLQLILYRHAFPTQAPTLSCSSSPRRPPRASPATPSPALESPAQAPGCIPDGRTHAARRQYLLQHRRTSRQAWVGKGRGLNSCGTTSRSDRPDLHERRVPRTDT